MKNISNLEEIKKVTLNKTDSSELADIRKTEIDPKKESKDKIRIFTEQIKNPYCFLYDNTIVKLRFDKNGTELKDKLRNFYMSLKKK